MNGMNEPLILLVTRDGDFAQSVRDALFGTGATVLVARDVRDGLQIVSQRGRELDFALMDFDDGCRGRTLLSAVHNCYERLPIVVTTSEKAEPASCLAYANGARTCLKKPLSVADLAKAIADAPDSAASSSSPGLTKQNIMDRIIEANFLPASVEEARENLNLARENGGYLQWGTSG
jgi:DNA-binding NtrC family response regulator